MTFMTLPKKLQKERRVDTAHVERPARTKKAAEIERAVAAAANEPTEYAEENCPVIRANHIVFSSGRMGRTRVVFY